MKEGRGREERERKLRAMGKEERGEEGRLESHNILTPVCALDRPSVL